MKKLLMLATAAFLVTGVAFACDGEGKKKECSKDKKACCKKGDSKKCCKKDKKEKEEKVEEKKS